MPYCTFLHTIAYCWSRPILFLDKNIGMKQNKLDSYYVIIRNKQVVLDMDAAVLYGVEMDDIINFVRYHPERFPSDFSIKLTEEERRQVNAISSSYAFTEAGILMLSTLIDSDEARNVAFEIIETFTEQQQFLRHIMVAEYKDEDGKKMEEAYMEDKLKHILARSSACI